MDEVKRSTLYTRGGDCGETSLRSGERVAKDHPRIESYGTVDELSALVGLARSLPMQGGADPEEWQWLSGRLRKVQDDLMHLCARLATSDPDGAGLPLFDSGLVDRLEREMDRMDSLMPPLKSFILPGGTPLAGVLDQARTVCRRAERRVLSLHRVEPVGDGERRYLNRLADWLFAAHRYANHLSGCGDDPWNPTT